MGQVGYRLAAGHRLRLTAASSDFPEFVPAPGNGEHRWLAASGAPTPRRSCSAAPGPALSVSVLDE